MSSVLVMDHKESLYLCKNYNHILHNHEKVHIKSWLQALL